MSIIIIVALYCLDFKMYFNRGLFGCFYQLVFNHGYLYIYSVLYLFMSTVALK